jgi:hypothetical protein
VPAATTVPPTFTATPSATVPQQSSAP